MRDMTTNYRDYSLFLGAESDEYQFVFFVPKTTLTTGTLLISFSGNPFSGQVNTTTSLVLRPNKLKTEESFANDFDEVEKFYNQEVSNYLH